MIYEDDLYEGDPQTWSQPLWQVEITVGKGLPGDQAQDIADSLEDFAVSVFLHNLDATDGDRWVIRLTTLGKPDLDAVRARLGGMEATIEAQPVEQKDWLEHVHKNFPPVMIGRFFVHGSHYTEAPPAHLVPLKIDAATAFGSGEHETTKGCLLELDRLARDHAFENVLDMGCGSGILAAGMKKLWPAARVTAIDIDPESINVTQRHAGMNGVTLSVSAGDGYHTPLVQENAPYDIIAANILAGPLIAMAPDLARVLKPGGLAVLSGLLERQAAEVAAAHEKEGLERVRSETLGAWAVLVLRKTGA